MSSLVWNVGIATTSSTLKRKHQPNTQQSRIHELLPHRLFYEHVCQPSLCVVRICHMHAISTEFTDSSLSVVSGSALAVTGLPAEFTHSPCNSNRSKRIWATRGRACSSVRQLTPTLYV